MTQLIVFVFGVGLIWILSAFRIKRWLASDLRPLAGHAFTWAYSFSLASALIFIVSASFGVILHLIGASFGSVVLSLATYVVLFVACWLERKSAADYIREARNIFANFSLQGLIRNLSEERLGSPWRQIFIAWSLLVGALLFLAYLYRITLPIGHQDQLSQYLFDALQIASLGRLSLNDYYQLGLSFRVDSFASFFDALIIQATNGWRLSILCRAFLIGVSLSLCATLVFRGTRSIFSVIFLLLIVLSLPDIWSIGVSGKHDAFVFFFEINVVVTALISYCLRSRNVCIFLSWVAIALQLIAVSIRLSSLALMVIIVPFMLYTLVINQRIISRKRLDHWSLQLRKNINLALAVSCLVLASLAFPLVYMNWKYLGNPFYLLSPPGALLGFFPGAKFLSNYDEFKELYNLRIDIPFIRNIATILYSAFGLEVIRFALAKAPATFSALHDIKEIIASIGPKHLMVSVLSLTPALFISLLNIKFAPKRLFSFAIMLYAWLLLWTVGISYTRVFLAGTALLVTYGLFLRGSLRLSFSRAGRTGCISFLESSIVIISMLYALLFSVWSFTHTLDLKSANGFTLDRDQGVVRFLEMTSQDRIRVHGGARSMIPGQAFRSQWRNILNSDGDSLHVLVNVPPYFAYLADNALIANSPLTGFMPAGYVNGVKCYSYARGAIVKDSCGGDF